MVNKALLSKIFYFLKDTKKILIGLLDSLMPLRKTYSQLGEDRFIENFFLKEIRCTSNEDYFCIDIGANEPTRLSNTYLFYRQGYRSILIEPDDFNCRLLRRFRKNDIVVRAAVGNESKLVKFQHAYASVFSSKQVVDSLEVKEVEYVPQITLDSLLDIIDIEKILFLSVDVEGFDLEVLEGACNILRRTILVCIEANTKESREQILSFLQMSNFEEIYFNGLNLILVNRDLVSA